MKKYILIIILFTKIGILHCLAQSWVTTHNISPTYGFFTPDYSFSTPGTPSVFDTQNIRTYYYYPPDSLIAFHVLEDQKAVFDSTQTDTLGFIVSSLVASSNAVLLSSQAIPINNGYKGVEINIRYNDLDNGQILVAYLRLYFRKDLTLTFSITGYQNNLTQLVSNKILFFDSIGFTFN